MKCFDFKKKKKGSAAAEASIAFPVVLILVISIVFYVVKISSREIGRSGITGVNLLARKRGRDSKIQTLFVVREWVGNSRCNNRYSRDWSPSGGASRLPHTKTGGTS